MWIGWLEVDVRLGDVHSLKVKRSIVRPVVHELRRRFDVAAAETDHLDRYRRAGLGVSLVAADRGHVADVLDRVERAFAGWPELEVLSLQRRVIRADDV